MIELYQFRPKFGVPNLSPFCLKLETWLKISGLAYKVNFLDDPRKGPLGKLPYIKDGALTLADSSIIIEYLQAEYNVDLDKHLSNEQKAITHSCKIMIEEHLYWALIYHRWLGDGWPPLKERVFGGMPLGLRQLAPVLVQRKIRADLNSQGLGRHSEEQINHFARQDLESLSTLLSDKPYFFGEQVSSIDAVLYATLCQIFKSSLQTPLLDIAQNFVNLKDYQERMGRHYFPEYYV
jgi:glutathione S-transferase